MGHISEKVYFNIELRKSKWTRLGNRRVLKSYVRLWKTINVKWLAGAQQVDILEC